MPINSSTRGSFGAQGRFGKGRLGSISNPAPSIASLRSAGITTEGAYWFSTTKQATPFMAYCKFNFIDGGDWALLLKVHTRADLPSGSNYWQNTTLFNETDFNLTSGTWSKYATWNGIAFNRVAMDMAGRVPPVMIFNTSRTFAEAITAAGVPSVNNGGLRADSTDPAFGAGAGHDFSSSSQFPMKAGSNFARQSGGLEWYIQGYGIGVWANSASTGATSDPSFGSLPNIGLNGAWIGSAMDEQTHTFNAISNGGADSAFGFGFAAGNLTRTGSAGYAEWNSGLLTDTLPGYVWVRPN
jgi:hypothetical protein